MPKTTDIQGQRFGRLVVLFRVPKKGKQRWMCQCDCGQRKEVLGDSLRQERTSSCGCFRLERLRAATVTHGHSKGTLSYSTWANMIQRCDNPRSTDWQWYGGRGVKVCERWKDFALFLEDMGERPPGMTLDRVDVDGDYTPDNCRWASAVEQARNRRNSRLIEHEGETRTIAEWSELRSIPYHRLYQRIQRGWPAGRALGF